MKKNVTLNINAQLDSYTTTKNKLTKRSKTVEIRSSQLSESRYTEKIDSILLDRVVYRFKVILLGDIGVGKTSILTRFVEGRYNSEYHCNVGVEFKVKSLFIDEAIGADLKIWDTCGEEKFRSLTRQYYREGNGKRKINSIRCPPNFRFN